MSNMDCHLSIESVDNGVVVRGHAYKKSTESGPSCEPSRGKEVEYVYESFENAMKNIPAIWSVLMEGGMPDATSKQQKVQDANMPAEPKMPKGAKGY